MTAKRELFPEQGEALMMETRAQQQAKRQWKARRSYWQQRNTSIPLSLSHQRRNSAVVFGTDDIKSVAPYWLTESKILHSWHRKHMIYNTITLLKFFPYFAKNRFLLRPRTRGTSHILPSITPNILLQWAFPTEALKFLASFVLNEDGKLESGWDGSRRRDIYRRFHNHQLISDCNIHLHTVLESEKSDVWTDTEG
jgi:hypothetical protein